MGRAQELHTVEVKGIGMGKICSRHEQREKTRAKDDEIQIARHNNVPLWAKLSANSSRCACFVLSVINTTHTIPFYIT